MGNSINYCKYRMNFNEIFVGFFIGFAISFLYINLIFHKPVFATAVAVVIGSLYIGRYKKRCMKKRDEMLVKQFKDLMESLVFSY